MYFGRSRKILGIRGAAAIVAAACSATLMLPGGFSVANAQTSTEVRAEAQRENERLNELVAQMEEGRDEVDGLDKQITDLAKQSVEVQNSLIEDRSQLREMVSTSYRWGGNPSIWDIALSSETLDDFVSRLYYANKVTQWQIGCVEKLDADKQELDSRMDQMEQARKERKEALAGLEETCAELSDSVNSLMNKAAGLEKQERAAEEARLAELAKQVAAEQQRAKEQQVRAAATAQAQSLAAEAASNPQKLEAEAEADDELAAKQKASAQEVSAEEYLSTNEDVQESVEDSPSTPEKETPSEKEMPPEEPVAAEVEEPAQEEAPQTDEEARGDEGEQSEADESDAQDTGGEWIECVASAYTIADNTPPGSTATASGIPLDESVPTVAMPVSSNPSQFYGSMVQIEYDGMTVIAMVTDCGGLGGGSRGLDITPAVFRAFGVDTGDDWGLRTVRYRFV